MFQIVLLIYEYLIAVETSFVQEKRFFNKSRSIKKDLPIADRLDRNFFGFDQDYYERMPLLINALQEVSHIDPETRTRTPRRKQFSKNNTTKTRSTTIINKFVRRTSPRPFIFEYKSPYPMPFAKANGSPRNWGEEYRNAQRLKNLQDVIKYLEKTLNAKFGDIYSPSSAQIAFSGMYLGSIENKDSDSTIGQETIRSQKFETKSNHYSDPLHFYKPNSPGDINLLADGLRFAPTFLTRHKEHSRENKHEIPKQSCIGNECLIYNKNIVRNIEYSSVEEVTSAAAPEKNNKPKSFVMINWFPVNKDHIQEKTPRKNELDKIYITTSRPVFQFKRKSTIPVRRFSYKNKKIPKFLKDRNRSNFIFSSTYTHDNVTIPNYNHQTTIKNYNAEIQATEHKNNYFDITTVGSNVKPTSGNIYTINYPKLNYSDVEDYHMGSSGVIPVEYLPPAIYPIVTPIIPLTDLFTPLAETTTTNPPEIIKFSPEDAKVPDHYYNIRKSDRVEGTERDLNYSESTEVSNDDYETNTLVVKLRNTIETTSKVNIDEVTNTEVPETKDEEDMYTTIATYVPQMNGHYRHVKHKNLITLLQENSEKYRKKRIESLLTTRNPTYVPMYVEIKRNRNNTVSDQN